MNKLQIASKISRDALGLARTCGPSVAARWLAQIPLNAKAIMMRGDLQPADQALGTGPYRARRRHAEASLAGPGVVSGIREIWVRDCYLKDDFLEIGPSSMVVDLGANIGNFTNLALAHGDGVRVVAVEPNLEFGRSLLRTAEANGWASRVQLVPVLLGGCTAVQDDILSRADYGGARFVSERDFVEQYELSTIDFLKCDIEGSEFQLLTPDSLLLAACRQLAIEVHGWGGSYRDLLAMLRAQGFEIGPVEVAGDSCVALARRR